MSHYEGWNELLASAAAGDLKAQQAVEKAVGLTEGGYARMLESFRSKKQLSRGEAVDMVELGLAYLQGIVAEKNPESAKYWLGRAVAKNENNPSYLYRLGIIYYKEYNELEEAKRLIERAIQIGPIPGVPQEEAEQTLQSINTLLK